jgi:PhzF family phenazine biosynthesis protein
MRVYQVDAFTDRAFRGNPAAVCILTGPLGDSLMQNIAMEMNLSETAFIYPLEAGFDLRWFTPKYEVNLCGHATLATAHMLWEKGIIGIQSSIDFHTRSGKLSAKKKETFIELDFPAELEKPAESNAVVEKALGVHPVYTGKNKFDYLIEVDSAETLRRLEPDFNLLRTIESRGFMVTSQSDTKGYDFISRFFAPFYGIDEDPVTGSAHCCLGPYWSSKLKKNILTGFQASRRGGLIKVRVEKDRVYLGGQAVTVMEGVLLLNTEPD